MYLEKSVSDEGISGRYCLDSEKSLTGCRMFWIRWFFRSEESYNIEGVIL